MISTIITAGGISRRFGTNKLLVKIDDLTVIEHTILKFLDLSDEIVIPATPQTRDFIEQSSVFDKNKITIAVNIKPATIAATSFFIPISARAVSNVSCLRRGIFDLPITLRLIDQRAVIVRIPASRAGILNLV